MVDSFNDTARRNKNILHLGLYIVLGIWTVITIAPLLYTLFTSFMSNSEINTLMIPDITNLRNYKVVLENGKLGTGMLNSLIVALLATVAQLSVGSMAAYGFSRLNPKGKTILYLLIISGVMIPSQVLLIPIAMMANWFGGYDQFWFIIMIYTALGVPYCTFIMTSFMQNIPKEIEEAAVIDGCGVWGRFRRVIFPLSQPILSTMGILCFISAWNELIFAKIILKEASVQTVPLALISFVSSKTADYTALCAAVIISIIPTVVVFILMQDKITKGLAAGAIKG